MEHQLANQIDLILFNFNIARNDLNVFKKHNNISKNSISDEFFSNIINLEKELKKDNNKNLTIIFFKTKHPKIIIDIINRCQFLKNIYKSKKEINQIVSISN